MSTLLFYNLVELQEHTKISSSPTKTEKFNLSQNKQIKKQMNVLIFVVCVDYFLYFDYFFKKMTFGELVNTSFSYGEKNTKQKNTIYAIYAKQLF